MRKPSRSVENERVTALDAPERRMKTPSSHFARMEQAIGLLVNRSLDQPALSEVAKELGMSEFHFHRLFVEFVGLTPKEFLQFITLTSAKTLLRESNSLLATAISVGLSGPSRLHDLFLTVDHTTPGEFKNSSGLQIHWGLVDTVLGSALLATTPRGICRFSFVPDAKQALTELRNNWPEATLIHDPNAVAEIRDEIDARLNGDAPKRRLGLLLKGTQLRLQVWRALIEVPSGYLIPYQFLAEKIGNPLAVRATASAVAMNPVAALIPCHRVIRATGDFGRYQWGTERKLAMLAREYALKANPESIRVAKSTA
jgi:AraC family transcriptional regulator, regulatory protein of adaptative response / methylated-DNA-[protein]-cysteine methyltransferase